MDDQEMIDFGMLCLISDMTNIPKSTCSISDNGEFNVRTKTLQEHYEDVVAERGLVLAKLHTLESAIKLYNLRGIK